MRRLTAKVNSFKSKKTQKTANDLLFTGQDEVLMYIIWSLILSCICACCWRGTRRGNDRENPTTNRKRRKRHEQYQQLEKEEENLELEVKRAESKLVAKKIQRQVITARMEQDNIENEITTVQDERGRSLYGDAWDNPSDGSVPIKELFGLNENELREIKIEAYNRMALEEKERNGGRGTIHSARIKSHVIDYKNAISSMQPEERENSMLLTSRLQSMNTKNENRFDEGGGGGGGQYEEGVDEDTTPLILTSRTSAKTKRSMKPIEKAPYDDPRFVRPRSGLNNDHSNNNIWVQEAGLRNPMPPPQLPPPSSSSRPKSTGGSHMNVDEWRQRTPRLVPPKEEEKSHSSTPNKLKIKKRTV